MHFFFHQQLNRKPHVHVRPVTTYSNSYKSSTACISNGCGLESIQDFNFRCAFKLKVRPFGLFTDVVAWLRGRQLSCASWRCRHANTLGQLRSKQMARPLRLTMISDQKGIFFHISYQNHQHSLHTLDSFWENKVWISGAACAAHAPGRDKTTTAACRRRCRRRLLLC